MKKKFSICFFGSYDKNFTSNLIVKKGLEKNDVTVVEVNYHVKMTRLDAEKDMTWWELAKRVMKKYKIFVEIAKHLGDIKNSDGIYIGFPGHFDVLIAYPLAKLFRKKIYFNPLVVFYTGFVDDQGILKRTSLLARVIKFAEKMIYKMSDVVIADTPLQREHLHKEFRVPYEKMPVLPIGADDDIYKYTPYTNKTQEITVIYYGLFAPLHGVEYIVEAAYVLRRNPHIRFLMVGNGNKYEVNFARAQKLKLTNMIFYKDMTEQNALETLSTGDIFLGFLQKHPTVERVIPNKVYQGLALGKAVVTADAPVIRSVFTNKHNIYTCKVADGESLAQAILTLQKDVALRQKIARNGYKLFKAEFTPAGVGKKFLEILQKEEAYGN